ncbi:MAG: glycine cleavage system protein GcvH [Candidatus Thermoplasmatota archaeon]|nr:glycine cleavage system protein GcvH [Candidatus Thermoplasmatota archaeon]
MSDIPEDLKYTEEHEWVRVEDGKARIGITDFAQDALTDVVYVELPFAEEGFSKGDSMVVVESVKSVSDVYAPVNGEVLEVNERLEEEPELVNEDPYGDGWMVIMSIEDEDQLDDLLDAAAYGKVTEA